MITPSFSPTATERVLPKLALDFTTASLDSRVTFTRTTDATHPATYVNSSGLVTAATNNQPRFDYDPVALTCKGLLIEESRANLLTYSNDITQTGWTSYRATIGTAAATSPDGTNNACKLFTKAGESVSGGIYRLGAPNFTGSTTYSYSCFVKPSGMTQVAFGYVDNATGYTGGTVIFTLTGNGSYSIYSGTPTATITPYPNSWYRITITFTTIAVPTYNYLFLGLMTIGDGTTGVYVYGFQLETGAFPTSYIPTTSAALTRNADVATMTGTNFSSWFNATEGTFEIEQSYYSVASVGGLVVSDFNNNYIFIDTTSGGVLRDRISTNGVTQTALSAGTITNNVTFKNTHGYKSTGASCALNGAATVTSGAITLPSGINQLQFNTNSIQSVIYSGHIRKLNYWPQKLTNNEVQAFSK